MDLRAIFYDGYPPTDPGAKLKQLSIDSALKRMFGEFPQSPQGPEFDMEVAKRNSPNSISAGPSIGENTWNLLAGIGRGLFNPIDEETGMPNVDLGVVSPAIKAMRAAKILQSGRSPSHSLSPTAKEIMERIADRNTVYHATDLSSAKSIIEDGKIVPSLGGPLTEGVSVSRVPRVNSKASKAISFEIDRNKIPPNRPFVEEDYGKTTPYESSVQGKSQLVEYPNKLFEFEDRTYNTPISTDAVKRILVDRDAIFLRLPFQEKYTSPLPEPEMITQWLKKIIPGLDVPVEVYPSGKAMHRARVERYRGKSPKNLQDAFYNTVRGEK